MLGVLCARTPKPWILSSLSSSAFHYHYGLSASTASDSHVLHRFVGNPIVCSDDRRQRRSFYSGAGLLEAATGGVGGGKAEDASVSVWHAVVPVASGGGDWRRDFLLPAAADLHLPRQRGEGSWNVAWDARPARWIHRLDSASLLFGVCSFLAPIDWNNFLKSQVLVPASESETPPDIVVVKDENALGRENDGGGSVIVADEQSCNAKSVEYRVTGVLADGRCLFRALAHGACLQRGEEAPDDDHQRELADELRALVAEELLKRRKETEWFIEGDFDAYVNRIQQPYVWGGEPELLMASHVLKTSIAVYMRDRSSGSLTKIADYGEEYQKEKEFPINVLFHGYGHYDLLEMPGNQSCENGNV